MMIKHQFTEFRNICAELRASKYTKQKLIKLKGELIFELKVCGHS